MALVRSRRNRRRVGMGGILDEIQKLPFANAELFPNVDFASLPPTTTIGDLLASGAITQAEYEAAYGAVPSADNADYQQQYDQMVRDIQAGIAAGYYTSDSLDGFTFERWLNQYTPLGSNATARAGGMVATADGGSQLVDGDGVPIAGAYAPPAPPQTPTGPARYLVNGIEYLSTGEVISVDGVAVTGKKLTAEQVNRLTSGGALTQAERDALLPPKPAPTGEAVAQTFQDANAGQSATPVQPSGGGGGGPGFAVSANGGGATAAPGGVGGLLSSPYLLLVLAAGAYLVLKRKH